MPKDAIAGVLQGLVEAQAKLPAKCKLALITRLKPISLPTVAPGDKREVFIRHENEERGKWSTPTLCSPSIQMHGL